MTSHARWIAIASFTLLAGCVTFKPLGAAVRSKPLAIDQLGAARVDVEASTLFLEARPGLELKSDILRLQLADALNEELGEAGGRAATPARFRAKVTATESNNAWAVALAPLTLVWAELLPYVNVSVRLELELQIGGARYSSIGVGDENVTAAAPKIVGEAMQSATGLALNDALNKLRKTEPAAIAAVR